jgi:predicted kinase
VLVNGRPGAGKSTLAAGLAAALDLPLIRKDAIKETLADVLGAQVNTPEWSRRLGAAASETMWTLLAESPIGAVIEGPYFGANRAPAVAALARAAVTAGEPITLHEVWCDVPIGVARARSLARLATRHPIHLDDPASLEAKWRAWALVEAIPLALGPVYRVDTSMPVTATEIRALAAKIRSNSAPGRA